MNENERTPAETAADYAVHFADGFFVPCPCCGKEVKSPDNGFTSERKQWNGRSARVTAKAQKHGSSSARPYAWTAPAWPGK